MVARVYMRTQQAKEISHTRRASVTDIVGIFERSRGVSVDSAPPPKPRAPAAIPLITANAADAATTVIATSTITTIPSASSPAGDVADPISAPSQCLETVISTEQYVTPATSLTQVVVPASVGPVDLGHDLCAPVVVEEDAMEDEEMETEEEYTARMVAKVQDLLTNLSQNFDGLKNTQELIVIDPDNKFLGEGKSAVVFKAQMCWEEDGVLYYYPIAVKRFKLGDRVSQLVLAGIERESHISLRINNAHCVRTFAYLKKNLERYLIMGTFEFELAVFSQFFFL
jgi:hypothetical protein